MKKIIGIILTIFFLVSCKNSDKAKSENNAQSENKITQSDLTKLESNQTESITQKILDLPKIQWIYHPEVKDNLPVKLLETDLIEKNFNLKKFGQRVRILSLAELEKEGIKGYVAFEELEIKNDTADFKLSYKIQGAISIGKLVKENGEWKVVDYSVWEK